MNMQQQDLEQMFESFLEDCKNFNFDYLISKDLEAWKKGVNQEYLHRKKILLVIDAFGIENIDRIEKIVLDEVNDIMLNNLIPTAIKLWFLPFKSNNKKEHNVSQYQLSVGKSLKK